MEFTKEVLELLVQGLCFIFSFLWKFIWFIILAIIIGQFTKLICYMETRMNSWLQGVEYVFIAGSAIMIAHKYYIGTPPNKIMTLLVLIAIPVIIINRIRKPMAGIISDIVYKTGWYIDGTGVADFISGAIIIIAWRQVNIYI